MIPATIQEALRSALQHHRAGRLQEAEAIYRRVLEQAPNNADALNHLGSALGGLGRPEEAAAACRKAIALRPNYAEAHYNLGKALEDTARFDEAVAAYEGAIRSKPDHAEAHWNMALLLLLKGDFARGWAEYEWRWRRKSFPMAAAGPPPKIWRGEDLSGRTILLHAEQGFGDTIQFIRYAPLLARRGARAEPVRVIVDCQSELAALIRGVEGVERVVTEKEPPPSSFDLQAPLMSLPLSFGTTVETIPAQVPYLRADERLVEAWRSRTAGGGCATRKVGLVWAGRPTHKNDRNRSIPLGEFAPLAEVKDVMFYSLQKGAAAEQAKNPPAGMKLIDFTADLRDFSDTAALIANLDLVISVDTSIVHLAGAMAKPVWTLLPFVPDWRWMLGREDSPWYPTMRLFRQEKREEWAEVIKRVGRELKRKA